MKTAILAVLPLALALAACQSSSRFESMGSRPPPPAPRVAAQPEPVMAAPTSPVSSEPLPPVDGSPQGATTLAPASPANPQVAAVTPAAPAPTPSARSAAGVWKISDAARGDCSISLTQQNLLDLYRATPNGCQASSLAKVNAWQQRGQEIVLLESGGRTAVRLFPKGDGTYEGQATTSGAVIRMSK